VRARAPALTAVALAFALLGAAATCQGVWGSFGGATADAANSITAASDFRAPTASASAIGKTAGGLTGQIKKGGTYYVYADLSDAGNPPSGVATVKANVSTITTGSTAVALVAGSYSAGRVAYDFRSASLTAAAGLAAGSYTYSLTSTDAAANTATQTGFGVTVDNTAPSGTDVQATNGGSIAGRAEAGDKVAFAFSGEIDPSSILAGWSGGSTGVVVRLNNGTGTNNDTMTIFNSINATQLPLGSVNLGRADYTSANVTFGATGTASSMAMSGSTVTITLGTQSAAATTAASTGTMSWTPAAAATDAAGNAVATTAVTETGSADKEF
jgi:hypothetical protein